MDDRPRITHIVEQLGGFLSSDLAPALARYWLRLVEEGVPEDAATRLTIAAQRRLLGGARDTEGTDE